MTRRRRAELAAKTLFGWLTVLFGVLTAINTAAPWLGIGDRDPTVFVTFGAILGLTGASYHLTPGLNPEERRELEASDGGESS